MVFCIGKEQVNNVVLSVPVKKKTVFEIPVVKLILN